MLRDSLIFGTSGEAVIRAPASTADNALFLASCDLSSGTERVFIIDGGGSIG